MTSFNYKTKGLKTPITVSPTSMMPITQTLETPKTKTQLLEEERRKVVFDWLRERTERDLSAITKFSGPHSLHEDYINYCEEKGLPQESMKALSRYMELYFISEYRTFLVRKRNYHGTLIPGLRLQKPIHDKPAKRK